MAGNKLRLYLGYWRRKETAANPGKYHIGLLLVPKKPGNNTVQSARRYHAVNVVDPATKTEVWKFEILWSEPRTNMLAGAMLLGKVPPSCTVESIEEILGKIYVPTQEEANKLKWRCRHWALQAIEDLAAANVISALPTSVHELWNTGREFIEGKTAAVSGYPVRTEWLFTCDTSGKEISSEIGPLYSA